MNFSEIISALKDGQSGLQSHQIGKNPVISSCASLEKGHSNQISFLEKGNLLQKELTNTQVGAILIPPNETIKELVEIRGISWAMVKDPRIAFAETLEILHPQIKKPPGIHPSAVIGEQVMIGEEVSIGANVYIADNTSIGDRSSISPGVVIYEDVDIGKDNDIHANAVIHRRTNIGDRCVINSNAVIGSEGFGFIPTPQGWRKMPQTGFVVIEDEVEIGACTTIDRPCVGQTIIGYGTKIDNLVQIGHGVITGKGCAFASQVGIAGGAHLGNGVILAGQVGVANRANIGDHVIASSKSGLHGDVAPNEIVSGFPALPNKLWLRCVSLFSKLPEITKTLRELKNELPR